MRDFVYVTSNKLKAETLGLHLKQKVEHQSIELQEIQSLDVAEVVRDKAQRACRIVGRPVLVEDFSLQIHSLGGLPGPLIKWFMRAVGPEGLCKMLEFHQSRSANVQVAMAYSDGAETKVFLGERSGWIARHPRGKKQWGPDMIFVPSGWDKTWAEMNEQELLDTSVRRLAVAQLETFLRSSNR
jgi:XTP/dITP diphosphohydrolase